MLKSSTQASSTNARTTRVPRHHVYACDIQGQSTTCLQPTGFGIFTALQRTKILQSSQNHRALIEA